MSRSIFDLQKDNVYNVKDHNPIATYYLLLNTTLSVMIIFVRLLHQSVFQSF